MKSRGNCKKRNTQLTRTTRGWNRDQPLIWRNCISLLVIESFFLYSNINECYSIVTVKRNSKHNLKNPAMVAEWLKRLLHSSNYVTDAKFLNGTTSVPKFVLRY